MKLAIVVSHPIQYYSPVFQLLAQKIPLKVFYTRKKDQYDPGFKCNVNWDIPLLEGYEHIFVSGAYTIPAITSFKPTHLLVYGWSPRGHVNILRHFKNRAHILFRGDSTLLAKQAFWKGPLRSLFLKKIYAYIDTALYVGTNNKNYFLKYGLQAHQLIFAPHAIDNARFSQPTAFIAFRQSLGLLPKDTLVLFAGKFTPTKNPLLLLRAFKDLAHPSAHLLFVGGGSLVKRMQKEAEGADQIHIWPFQNQQTIPLFYQACDLFCLPSRSESWGLAINEAMACGKAVLASDQCGAAADLLSPENGSVFKSNNFLNLQKQLCYYLSNPSLLEKAGLYARRNIKEWSFEVQVENVIKQIHHV